MTTKNAVIIYSGYNQRGVIAFCRVLLKYNLPFGIIARDDKDSIFSTSYKNNVVVTRSEKQLRLDSIIQTLKTAIKVLNTDSLLIAPSSEALNRFFLTNKRSISLEVNVNIPLVEESLYNRISDKYSFGQLCGQNGISIPTEYEDIDHYPMVAKPQKYFSIDGKTPSPYIINSAEEFIEFKKQENIRDFYFQEFIGGESLYLLYYVHKNSDVTKYSQKNLVQQSNGKSILAAISSSIHKESISDRFEKMLIDVGFYGLIMIELKLFNNNYYMIEANPRFWGPSQLFVDSGSGIFHSFLKDNGFLIENEEKENTNTKYFWFGGLSQELKNNKKLAFHEYSNSCLELELKDWLKNDVYNRSDTNRLFLNELI